MPGGIQKVRLSPFFYGNFRHRAAYIAVIHIRQQLPSRPVAGLLSDFSSFQKHAAASFPQACFLSIPPWEKIVNEA